MDKIKLISTIFLSLIFLVSCEAPLNQEKDITFSLQLPSLNDKNKNTELKIIENIKEVAKEDNLEINWYFSNKNKPNKKIKQGTSKLEINNQEINFDIKIDQDEYDKLLFDNLNIELSLTDDYYKAFKGDFSKVLFTGKIDKNSLGGDTVNELKLEPVASIKPQLLFKIGNDNGFKPSILNVVVKNKKHALKYDKEDFEFSNNVIIKNLKGKSISKEHHYKKYILKKRKEKKITYSLKSEEFLLIDLYSVAVNDSKNIDYAEKLEITKPFIDENESLFKEFNEKCLKFEKCSDFDKSVGALLPGSIINTPIKLSDVNDKEKGFNFVIPKYIKFFKKEKKEKNNFYYYGTFLFNNLKGYSSLENEFTVMCNYNSNFGYKLKELFNNIEEEKLQELLEKLKVNFKILGIKKLNENLFRSKYPFSYITLTFETSDSVLREAIVEINNYVKKMSDENPFKIDGLINLEKIIDVDTCQIIKKLN